MSKKLKIVISAALAVLMLTFGGAAVAMAQDDTGDDTGVTAGGVLARVAEILGIPQETLVEAFEQARGEMREECLSGNCTQEGMANGYQERRFGKQEEWVEKKQEQINKYQNRWMEKRQDWVEKRQGPGGASQQGNNGAAGQGNGQMRVSQSARGQQMIAVAEDWQGTLPLQTVDQIY